MASATLPSLYAIWPRRIEAGVRRGSRSSARRSGTVASLLLPSRCAETPAPSRRAGWSGSLARPAANSLLARSASPLSSSFQPASFSSRADWADVIAGARRSTHSPRLATLGTTTGHEASVVPARVARQSRGSANHAYGFADEITGLRGASAVLVLERRDLFKASAFAS